MGGDRPKRPNLGCRLCLPPELERELTFVEFVLPGKEKLSQVLDGVLESTAISSLPGKEREAALDRWMLPAALRP